MDDERTKHGSDRCFFEFTEHRGNNTKTVENAWFRSPNGRRLLGTGALQSSLLAAAATPNNAVMARSPQRSVDPVPVTAPYQPGAMDPFAFMGVPDGTLGQKGGMVKPKKAKSRRAPLSPEQRLACFTKHIDLFCVWKVKSSRNKCRLRIHQ